MHARVSREGWVGSRGAPRTAVIVGLCLLVMAGVAAIVGARTAAVAQGWAAHSLEVRRAEAELFSLVQDAETGQRGYLLTGDPVYLQPYVRAVSEMPRRQAKLILLVSDNPAQKVRAARLNAAIDAKLAELGRTVDLQRRGRGEDAVASVRSGVGRQLMHQVRVVDGDFDRAELRLLRERQDNSRRLGLALTLIVFAATSLAGLLALLIVRAARLYEAELHRRNDALIAEIDARERAEAQLRQAQKMEALGQLTGGVAHDFNNMLAIIVGNLDILLRRLPADDPKLRTLVDNALSGANRAAGLTQRLLAFSRLQPLAPKPTDVNKCVADMSEVLRRTLGEGVIVETVLGGGLWRAFVDYPQLESALLNLAVNARDAMPNGGRLTLETANAALDEAYAQDHAEVTAGQYVLVAVTDTGGGMTPEVMARAFDPFFTTKGVGEGTGLGLSQVHGFLRQSKGHIKIYSEIGVGTTVKLYLPRDLSGAVAPAPVRAAAGAPIDQRFKVLVVEDDPGVREVAVGGLRELGFQVIEADSAAIALERLDAHDDITILLTDVVMPLTDGRRLVEAALRVRPELRVLYMTGYTRNAIVHNGVLDAGVRLLTKPFTVEQLDREMRSILGDLL